MTRRNIALVSIISMLIWGLFLAWVYPTTQDLMLGNPFWNGLGEFNRKSTAERLESPVGLATLEKTVLVSIPYTPYRAEELERIKQFVSDGGTLAILDDFGYGNSILKYLGLTVEFSRLPLLDPLFNFKNAELPRTTYFEGRFRDKGLVALALNRPSTLLNVESVSVLARSSETSFLDTNGDGFFEENEPRGPFPVAAETVLGNGKVVLVSDASIVINGMIGRDDNFRFLQETLGLGDKHVIIDDAHMPPSVLDQTKVMLAQARQILSYTSVRIGLVLLVLLLALSPLWRQRTQKEIDERRHQAA